MDLLAVLAQMFTIFGLHAIQLLLLLAAQQTTSLMDHLVASALLFILLGSLVQVLQLHYHALIHII